MDYEKAYKESFEAAKGLYDAGNALTKKQMEIVFPQLAESEDERIRRTLAEYFGPEVQLDFVRGVPIQKIRDWLEKQKEQKPTEINFKALLTADRLASAEMTGRLKERSEILENPEKYGLQKPAEWSEEDEEVMEDLYNFVISDFIQDHIHETRRKPWKTTLERNRQNRLKSIRPVSKESLQSWKPSEEQLTTLLRAEGISRASGYPDNAKVLASLYEQIKKL